MNNRKFNGKGRMVAIATFQALDRCLELEREAYSKMHLTLLRECEVRRLAYRPEPACSPRELLAAGRRRIAALRATKHAVKMRCLAEKMVSCYC